MLQAVNYPDKYVQHSNRLGQIATISTKDQQNALFRLRKGLAGGNSVSFESVSNPGQFLRHQGFEIKLQSNDNSDLFKQDASFNPLPGLAGRGKSFESVNFPGHYLRHCSFKLFIDNNRRGNRFCNPKQSVYLNDVSYILESGKGQ